MVMAAPGAARLSFICGCELVIRSRDAKTRVDFAVVQK